MATLTIVVQAGNKDMSNQVLDVLKKATPSSLTLDGISGSAPMDFARRMVLVEFVTAEDLNQALPDDGPHYKIMPITEVSLGVYFDKNSAKLSELSYFNALEDFANEYTQFHLRLLLEKFPGQEAVLENPYKTELEEQRMKWASKKDEQLRASNHSLAPTFFSKKESPNNANHRSKAFIVAGGLLGLVSFFLCFLEPISATLLAIAAAGLIFGGIANRGQESPEYSHEAPAL